MKEVNVETEHLVDVIHLNRSFNKQIGSLTFNKSTFPSSGKDKKYLKERLCDDLAYRLRSEYQAAKKKLKTEAISRRLLSIVDSLAKCYAGNHGQCSKLSLICRPSRPYSSH